VSRWSSGRRSVPSTHRIEVRILAATLLPVV
jgi:hypothetical protein